MPVPYDVAIARCDSYDPAIVRQAIEESLVPFGGIASVAREGSRILLKINLLAAKRPEDAVTTHPEIVRAVIRMVQECGAEAIVGDSPGGRNTPASYRALLKKTGILDVIEETGATMAYFDEPRMERVSDRARTFKKFTVTSMLDSVDAVICLPKLKTHQFTLYTGAVKLLYGYIPGIIKAEYHLHAGRDVTTFAELLLDLHDTFPPDLTIMDAVVGMEGTGPQSGMPRQIGLVLAGRSCPAIDFVATSIVGIDPFSVPTITCALERGSGPGSITEIPLQGPPLEDVRVSGFRHPAVRDIGRIPPAFFAIADRLLANRPVIDPGRCVRCGVCAEDCPPGAIAFSKGSIPDIDYSLCIRCFCCQELCPSGAVYVKTPILRRIIG